MLILTRWPGQKIRVATPEGSHMWITVDAADHDRHIPRIIIDSCGELSGVWYEQGLDCAQVIRLDGNDVIIAHLGHRCGRRNNVRIGIEAPASYQILRQELLDRPRP